MPAFLNRSVFISWLKQFLKLTVSVSLIYYCFTLIDINEVVKLLREVNYIYTALSFCLIVLGTIIFKALITWYFLKKHNKVSYLELIKINFSMRFYTMVLPKAVVAGIRWNKYRNISDPRFSFVLIAFEALSALTIAALATLLFMYCSESGYVPLNMQVLSIIVCLIFVFFMCVLFLYPNSRIILYAISILNSIKPLRFLASLIEKWRETSTLLEMYRIKNFLSVFAIGSISHLMFLLGAYFLFSALGVEISFWVVAWVRSAVFIFVAVPISIAGVGIREVGFVALFGLYGMEPDIIIAYSMLALTLQVGIAIIGIFTELESWF